MSSTDSMASSSLVEQWLERNKDYSKSHVPMPFIPEFPPEIPRPRVLAFVCCDARVDPVAILGLKLGEAIVIRNAGCYVPLNLNDLLLLDAVWSFQEILIIQHTDCGVTYTTNDAIRQHIHDTAPPDQAEGIDALDFGTFENDLVSTEERARKMVGFIRASPLVRKALAENTVGAVYDIKTGQVKKVT